MIVLPIAAILSDFFIFLALTDEEWLDRQEAAEMKEWLGGRLRELDKGLLCEFIDAFAMLAHEEQGQSQDLVRKLASDFHLEEALAAADTTRSEERHAQRDILQIARILADISLLLEVTGEEKLNLDDAVKMSEFFGAQLEELDKGFLRELVDAFAAIAPEYGDKLGEMVRDIPYYFSLDEAIASDDPVRLAELEAQRDAREDSVPDLDFVGIAWRSAVRRPYLAEP